MEEKKQKKPSEPCVYGEKEPTNVNQVNEKYIRAFLTDKFQKGEVTAAQIEAFMKIMENDSSKMKRATRRKFAEMFMPGILPQPEEPELYDYLAALIGKK